MIRRRGGRPGNRGRYLPPRRPRGGAGRPTARGARAEAPPAGAGRVEAPPVHACSPVPRFSGAAVARPRRGRTMRWGAMAAVGALAALLVGPARAEEKAGGIEDPARTGQPDGRERAPVSA